ncbi:Hypothetical predicted protein [Pelobates cultripes]|uniref:Uncharacterized protein n=1 Tax=Pelobates cultripes TaxID=61616 RepID=A0AAD1SCA7_PELCU|nr:Hypothetical predicted protein [Pelobates cultripes]
MINKQKSKSYIAQPRDHQGRVQRLPDAIAKVAHSYCENLYSTKTARNHAQPNRKTAAIHAYLETNIHMKITEDAKRTLETPLTLEELTAAVKTTKPSKSPGPDDLTIPYNKQFADILYPQVLTALNSLTDEQKLTTQTLAANVTLTSKDGNICSY